jgi:hypothetical protein
MNNSLKILLILSVFAGCENSKNGSSDYFTKVGGTNNQNNRNFVFEKYEPASKEQCPGGGWKLIPTSDFQNPESIITTEKILTSCVTPDPEPKIVNAQDALAGTEYDSTLPSYPVTGDPLDQSVQEKYLKLCQEKSEELDAFSTALKELATRSCDDFAAQVVEMYQNGQLSLISVPPSPADETFLLSNFLPFAPNLRAISFSCSNIRDPETLLVFNKLLKVELFGCTDNSKVIDFIPTSVEYLSVNDGELTKFNTKSKLDSLQVLLVNGNKLTGIPDLAQFKALKQVVLRKNLISKVPDFSALMDRELNIDISFNPIADYGPLIDFGFSEKKLTIVSDLQSRKRLISFK